ncbi:MAG: ABC transporter ATP-binding protein [Flavobacteriaceae bacterium]
MGISVRHVSKSYGKVDALVDVSFEVHPGEIFGLIGPDGAGKTTLFHILTTLLLQDQGQATVAGFDVNNDYRSIRGQVGYMPGRFSLYQDLTVAENLNFFATIFGTTLAENYDLIKEIYVQIEPFKGRRAGKLSGGMKQKLALCCALIHKPKVLFLDEPTTGVDPVSRKEFWDMLKRLQLKGITILVSTPYMDEAALCDRIALMMNGKILQIDTPQAIVSSFPFIIYNVKTAETYRLIQDLAGYAKTHSAYPFGEYLHFTSSANDFKAGELVAYLKEKKHKQIVVSETQPSIEDTFMELSKQPKTVSNEQ